jgi:hypothetical protein
MIILVPSSAAHGGKVAAVEGRQVISWCRQSFHYGFEGECPLVSLMSLDISVFFIAWNNVQKLAVANENLHFYDSDLWLSTTDKIHDPKVSNCHTKMPWEAILKFVVKWYTHEIARDKLEHSRHRHFDGTFGRKI